MAQTIPPGGSSALPADLSGTVRSSDGGNQFSRAEWVDVSGQPFNRALRVDTTKQPSAPWGAQIKWLNDQPIAAGDAVLAAFWLRATRTTTETGDATVELNAQLSGPPWNGFGGRTLSVGTAWKQYLIPLSPKRDYPPGQAQFAFNCGFRPQTVELGDLRIINYGKEVKVTDLPATGFTYLGRELDAAWRKEALDRIEKHRKAELVVRVVDAKGAPVPDAQVQVRMKRHAFGFGACVVADRINGNGPDHEKYREILAQYFNKAVYENDLKWTSLLRRGKQRWTEIDKSIEWLRQHGFEIRGHNFVWPGQQWLPGEAKELLDNPDALRQLLRGHIAEVGEYFAGRLDEWDVINEPVHNHALQDVLGREAMVDWFKWARQADPHAKMYLNDYTMLSGGARDQGSIDRFYDNVKFLVDNGAPIDGIGEQGHFSWNLTPPTRVLDLLNRFSSFGLPIQITEFDVNVTDEDLQADYLRDFYTAAFSHPNVNGILMWGFWQKSHWMPDAALWRADWSMKRAAHVYIELTTKQWWTNADLKTGADGTVGTRAFLGKYDVIVTLGDHTRPTSHAHLSGDGSTLEVQLLP